MLAQLLCFWHPLRYVWCGHKSSLRNVVQNERLALISQRMLLHTDVHTHLGTDDPQIEHFGVLASLSHSASGERNNKQIACNIMRTLEGVIRIQELLHALRLFDMSHRTPIACSFVGVRAMPLLRSSSGNTS
jgi:hypothetical protein